MMKLKRSIVYYIPDPIIHFIKEWSWVIVFTATCLAGYIAIVKNKNETFLLLSAKVYSMEIKKTQVLCEKNELTTQVNSQNDPLWIEMLLMKALGLVPSGQMKVYFDI